AERAHHSLAHHVCVRAQLAENLARHATLVTDQPEQDVLGADVGVIERDRLAQRELERPLRARRERDLAGRRRVAGPDLPSDALPDVVGFDTELVEYAR